MKQRPRIYYTEEQKALMWDGEVASSTDRCILMQTLEYLQQKEAIDPEPSFRLLKKCFLIES